jgi:hypothetical protein
VSSSAISLRRLTQLEIISTHKDSGRKVTNDMICKILIDESWQFICAVLTGKRQQRYWYAHAELIIIIFLRITMSNECSDTFNKLSCDISLCLFVFKLTLTILVNFDRKMSKTFFIIFIVHSS